MPASSPDATWPSLTPWARPSSSSCKESGNSSYRERALVAVVRNNSTRPRPDPPAAAASDLGVQRAKGAVVTMAATLDPAVTSCPGPQRNHIIA